MTLVSHTRKFIYLKTHKTGGTSMEMALAPYCAPPGHDVLAAGPAIISDEGIVAARFPYIRDDKTGWINHMRADKIKERLGDDVFGSYLKLAMIRNPFDKAVSWFWHNNRKRTLPEGQALIEEFREFLAFRDGRSYFASRKDKDWRVTHIGTDLVVDMFVPLERLAELLPEVERRIGLEPGALEIHHANKKSRRKDMFDVPDYYDDKTADILRRNWDWIFAAGGYSPDPKDAGRASLGKAGQRADAATATGET